MGWVTIVQCLQTAKCFHINKSLRDKIVRFRQDLAMCASLNNQIMVDNCGIALLQLKRHTGDSTTFTSSWRILVIFGVRLLNFVCNLESVCK